MLNNYYWLLVKYSSSEQVPKTKMASAFKFNTKRQTFITQVPGDIEVLKKDLPDFNILQPTTRNDNHKCSSGNLNNGLFETQTEMVKYYYIPK